MMLGLPAVALAWLPPVGCTGPSGAAGAAFYNGTYKVLQYCDGTNWKSLGSRNQGGGSGQCSTPTGVATVNAGYIYTSIDGGATWTQQTSSGSRSWNAIALSSVGTKLTAGGASTDIYTATCP
jgi:hypothetical protein